MTFAPPFFLRNSKSQWGDVPCLIFAFVLFLALDLTRYYFGTGFLFYFHIFPNSCSFSMLLQMIAFLSLLRLPLLWILNNSHNVSYSYNVWRCSAHSFSSTSCSWTRATSAYRSRDLESLLFCNYLVLFQIASPSRLDQLFHSYFTAISPLFHYHFQLFHFIKCYFKTI